MSIPVSSVNQCPKIPHSFSSFTGQKPRTSAKNVSACGWAAYGHVVSLHFPDTFFALKPSFRSKSAASSPYTGLFACLAHALMPTVVPAGMNVPATVVPRTSRSYTKPVAACAHSALVMTVFILLQLRHFHTTDRARNCTTLECIVNLPLKFVPPAVLTKQVRFQSLSFWAAWTDLSDI